MFKNNKKDKNEVFDVVQVFILLTLNIFLTFF